MNVSMNAPPNVLEQYWKMQCISLGSDALRYRAKTIPTAQHFFESQVLDAQQATQSAYSLKAAQATLISQFQNVPEDGGIDAQRDIQRNTQQNMQQSAQAGLCLRCYVSTPILRACQKLDSIFSGNKAFTYRDLLPFVLNDDGKKLLVVKADKTQLVLEEGKLKPSPYSVFSVDVLKSYQNSSADSMSLENWTFLRTKQHPELKSFLSEFGFQQFSNWTLINRIQVNQLERLSVRDRDIVEAFHAVYRRDRRLKGKVTRCADPTDVQLTEMNALLGKRKTAFATNQDLMKALKQIGKQLRTFDIWQAREPLETQDIETGDYTLRNDLPTTMLDATELEEQDFMDFLGHQLGRSLTEAVEHSVQAKIAKLKKSKRYAPFAKKLVPGLLQYYQEGISLKVIGQQLGMNNWDQTRRILNPGELLSQVRLLTTQRLLDAILKQAQVRGLASDPPEPAYLSQLMTQLESFLDEKLFSEAAAELKAGKNRSLESDYAQQLTVHLQQLI